MNAIYKLLTCSSSPPPSFVKKKKKEDNHHLSMSSSSSSSPSSIISQQTTEFSLEYDERRYGLSVNRFIKELKKKYPLVKIITCQSSSIHYSTEEMMLYIINIEPNYPLNDGTFRQLSELLLVHDKRINELVKEKKLIIILDVEENYKDHVEHHHLLPLRRRRSFSSYSSSSSSSSRPSSLEDRIIKVNGDLDRGEFVIDAYYNHFKECSCACHCIRRRLIALNSMLYNSHNTHVKFYHFIWLILNISFGNIKDIVIHIVYYMLHSMYDKGEIVKKLVNIGMYRFIEYPK